MCLSTVFKDKDGQLEQIASQISEIRLDGPVVRCIDIIGVETEVEGSIASIDLIGNKIIVKAS